MSIPDEPTYDAADLADSLESSVLALLRVPPIRQALHDLLRIYGISAQSSEVIRNQSMQMQALAEVMTIVLGRQIEHERRSVRQQAASEKIIDLLQKITDDPAGVIAKAAAEALALLQATADTQPEPIETEAARARTLLRVAQPTANRADMADAVATAQTLREDATAPAPAPADTEAQTLRAEATEAAEAATETAAAAAAQTLRAAAAETAAVDAEAREV